MKRHGFWFRLHQMRGPASADVEGQCRGIISLDMTSGFGVRWRNEQAALGNFEQLVAGSEAYAARRLSAEELTAVIDSLFEGKG